MMCEEKKSTPVPLVSVDRRREMKKHNAKLTPLILITKLGLLLMMGMSMSACSATSWKEEVLLHDGSKVVVKRTVERGGRHEIGQRAGATNETLSFTLPGTGQAVTWEDKFSEDIGSSNFNLLMLEILDGTAYLVASPMGCLSYNKWGRPNPPYVVFKYQGNEWQRIALHELPAELKIPNLVISSPDDAAEKASHGVVSAETIKNLNSTVRQPEYKTILREAMPEARIKQMCEELIFYKGSWIMPNDPVARRMLDRDSR